MGRFNYKAMQFREFKRDHPLGSSVRYADETYDIVAYLDDTLQLRIFRTSWPEGKEDTEIDVVLIEDLDK